MNHERAHVESREVVVAHSVTSVSPSVVIVVDMEGKRGKLCAALEHANRCGFNNCDRIDGACGKTKRIIKVGGK